MAPTSTPRPPSPRSRRAPPRPASLWWLALAWLPGTWVCGICSGCAAAPVTSTTRDLPPYAGSQARLFDDSLSLRLANPTLEGAGEGLLRARATEADLVLLGRLRSVNERNVGNRSLFSLVFTWEKVLAGSEPEGEALIVEVPPDTASHALVRSRRSKLVGVPVVLFLKWFRDDDGPKLHARVEPDDPSVRDAVIAARM